jgi:hypothetical protein
MREPDKNRQNHNSPDQPDLDVLQAGLFFLMTQYTFRQCPRIADKIVEHLVMLCNHPQIALMPSQNHLFAKMINVWRARQFGHGDGGHSGSLH